MEARPGFGFKNSEGPRKSEDPRNGCEALALSEGLAKKKLRCLFKNFHPQRFFTESLAGSETLGNPTPTKHTSGHGMATPACVG